MNRFMSALVLTLALPASGVAEQPAEQSGQPSAKEWLSEREAEFKEYRFEVQVAKPVELKIQPHSLLNWSNPERTTELGGMFLWTQDGLPQMIACAFELDQVLKHEFQSLSTSPITAARGGAEVHKFRPGIEWKVLPKAPAPAEKRTLRLSQVRRQAERFGVRFGEDGKGWTLTRLLPQPIYRAPETAPEDVSLFVFVQGTDPECVLLLATDSEAPKNWRYALARQTKWGLKVTLDDAEIWSRPPDWRSPPDPESPLFVIPQKEK